MAIPIATILIRLNLPHTFPYIHNYMNFLSIFQMMADLLFRKGEYDSATFHFQEILSGKPSKYWN